MKIDDVDRAIGELRHTSIDRCHELYEFVLREKPKSILETGFCHGKSAAYMAAALDELGTGSIMTIDVKAAERFNPTIHSTLASLGLERYVTPIFSPVGASWELRCLLEQKPRPAFDFCFIDAFHSWDATGLEFFLVEKLLKPGGWLLLDDINWTFASSPSWGNRPETAAMPEEFKSAAQVGDVYRLLVKEHPAFGGFRDDGCWGWARKRSAKGVSSNWLATFLPRRALTGA